MAATEAMMFEAPKLVSADWSSLEKAPVSGGSKNTVQGQPCQIKLHCERGSNNTVQGQCQLHSERG